MNLTQGLHRAVQQHPDGIATICDGRTRTHAESVDRIARLAAGLTYCGVEDGERAAILSLNSDRYHEFLAARSPSSMPQLVSPAASRAMRSADSAWVLVRSAQIVAMPSGCC